mmetsp:Transcript_42961/g.138100  ORF Transcript_42961/g.138100 Transcript_42961/m.138100 type:complete len:326 (+) Transcript_42961:52-1029(+)
MGDQDPANLPSWRTSYSTQAAEQKTNGGSSWLAHFTVRNLKGGGSGNFTISVQPHWAPVGARRFRRLLEEHFFDQCRFFRVVKGFMAQFGISGDPDVNTKYRGKTIADDIVKFTNQRGRVSFAMSGTRDRTGSEQSAFAREYVGTEGVGTRSKGIDSRTTQIFISLGDNRFLDKQGFAPFAEVVEGMETIDLLYNGYGEGAPRGQGPDQNGIQKVGNEYLEKKFPLLSYVESVEFSSLGSVGDAARAEELSGVASRLGPPMMVILPLLLVALICMIRICCKVCRMFCEEDQDDKAKAHAKTNPDSVYLGKPAPCAEDDYPAEPAE